MRNFIDLVEGVNDTMLYHVSPERFREVILRDGVKPRSYWAIESVSEYYEEDAGDNGDYFIIALPISRFDENHLVPDLPGIEEPVVYSTMGKSSSRVYAEWTEAEGTWQDTLEIIGSVAYDAPVRITSKDIL